MATTQSAIAIKERPILFSAPMVRAIMEGRKTQTRRVVRKYHGTSLHADLGFYDVSDGFIFLDERKRVKCPYGVPGDRLWVRETWVELLAVSPATDQPMTIGPGERLIEAPTNWTDNEGRVRWHYDGRVIAYRANSEVEFCDGDGFMYENANKADMPRWRSPVFMPRWASRLTLEIVKVRVERVQDISWQDALAEGIQSDETWHGHDQFPVRLYAKLWDSINLKRGYGWNENPWVWVIEFKQTTGA